ncbi:hypothetical protein T4C_1766 [Trichinella pseudospiralis]|uniref:Uncharacterized protein n=1 Tax=Trichinella pseudospiralis TaxID=6337 RepID=A0A0V1JUP7_TRIPS|nr:hypothetical protein T4C_1766 [Trichinella pseudospiralis]
MPVLHAYGLHEIANMYKSFSEFTDFYNHIEQYEAVGLQQLIEDGSYPHNNSDIFFCAQHCRVLRLVQQSIQLFRSTQCQKALRGQI